MPRLLNVSWTYSSKNDFYDKSRSLPCESFSRKNFLGIGEISFNDMKHSPMFCSQIPDLNFADPNLSPPLTRSDWDTGSAILSSSCVMRIKRYESLGAAPEIAREVLLLFSLNCYGWLHFCLLLDH